MKTIDKIVQNYKECERTFTGSLLNKIDLSSNISGEIGNYEPLKKHMDKELKKIGVSETERKPFSEKLNCIEYRTTSGDLIAQDSEIKPLGIKVKLNTPIEEMHSTIDGKNELEINIKTS